MASLHSFTMIVACGLLYLSAVSAMATMAAKTNSEAVLSPKSLQMANTTALFASATRKDVLIAEKKLHRELLVLKKGQQKILEKVEGKPKPTHWQQLWQQQATTKLKALDKAIGQLPVPARPPPPAG